MVTKNMPTFRCNCYQAMHRRRRHGRYVLYIGMEYLGSTACLDIYRAHDADLATDRSGLGAPSGPGHRNGHLPHLGQTGGSPLDGLSQILLPAVWSLDTLSTYLTANVIGPMILASGQIDTVTGRPVADLNIDGHHGRTLWTACRPRRMASRTPRRPARPPRGTVIHWAHNWIVGAITLRLPHWRRIRWVLPAVFTLYRKKADCNRTHPFATRQVLAARMVCQVATALPGVHIRVPPMASMPHGIW